jgi:putative transport protein
MTSTIIERVESEHHLNKDSDDCQLHLGDIVRVTGTKEQLEKIKLILGEEMNEQVQFHDNLKVLRVLVTSKNIIGKKISQIKELKAYRGVIAKIRRSGIDIAPHDDMILLLGDKLYIVAPEENAKKITDLIGNNLLLFPAADFLPISVGIVIGILVGSIPVSIFGLSGVKISFVGGILITALVLGRLGRTGQIVWQLSPHSTTLMKTLGQLIFMATIGTNAGKYLVESIQTHGFNAILMGGGALIFSLLITGHIAYRIFKLNFITVLGLLSGAMTSTPSLTMANNITKSDYPAISYAAVYPFSLITTIVLSQLILKL